MPFVVAFENFTPSPRFDGTSWIGVLIYESATEIGPWTLIQEITFPDPDTDPVNPKQRSFTATNASLQNGWYQASFVDASGALQQPTEPLFNGSLHTYEPNIDQVARKIMSRTRDKYGKTLGTFTNETFPSNTQVQAIASDVTLEIADVIGDVIPDAFADDATNVAALRAAMQVELNFFPEQINTNRSSYAQMKEQYEESLMRLQRVIELAAEGHGGVTDTAPSLKPSYSFPNDFSSLRW